MRKNIIVSLCLAITVISTYWFFKPRVLESFDIPQNKPSDAELSKAFPGDSRNILENSETFTLYSIDPYPGREGPNRFQDYAVIGQTTIQDPEIKRNLIAYLYSGMADANLHAACFNPHHAIRATKGNKIVDMLICFSCSGIEIYYGQAKGQTFTSNAPRAYFDSVLKKYNVPLDGR